MPYLISQPRRYRPTFLSLVDLQKFATCTFRICSPSTRPQTRRAPPTKMRHLVRVATQLTARQPAACAIRYGTARLQQRRQHSLRSPATSSWLPVPFVTATLAAMSHTTDLFSRLLKERIVAVYGEVDDRMAWVHHFFCRADYDANASTRL